MTTKRWMAALAAVALLAAAGCSDDDDEVAGGDSTVPATMPAADDCEADGATDAAADTQLTVELSEWFVRTDAEVAAGAIGLSVQNQGGESHELVIVRADSADDLTVVDGKVDEDALPEGAFIGEVEEFSARSSCAATFELEAGTYVLFCNLVEVEDDGEIESHFLEGMQTVLTVT